jgi:RND superfamily putative drug exporter
VVGVWLVILFLIGPLAGQFEDAQENDPVDYLPASAESVEAIHQLEGFPSEDQADAITVFHRDGGSVLVARAQRCPMRLPKGGSRWCGIVTFVTETA